MAKALVDMTNQYNALMVEMIRDFLILGGGVWTVVSHGGSLTGSGHYFVVLRYGLTDLCLSIHMKNSVAGQAYKYYDSPMGEEGTLLETNLTEPYDGIAIAYRVLIGDPDTLWLGTGSSRPLKDWDSRDTWPYVAGDTNGNCAVGNDIGRKYDAISAHHNHVCLSDSGFTLLHATAAQVWYGSFVLANLEDLDGNVIGAVWHYKYQDSYACSNGSGASGYAAFPSALAGAVVSGVFHPTVKLIDRLPPWSLMSPNAGEYMTARFMVVDAVTYEILGYAMGTAMNPGVQNVLNTSSGYFLNNVAISNAPSLLVPWGNFDGAQTTTELGLIMSDD